jgi:hypothetical protein
MFETNFITQQSFQSQRRIPTPPPLPNVRVRALRATFCVDGKLVDVGQIVSVSQDAAALLEFLGKAELVKGPNV